MNSIIDLGAELLVDTSTIRDPYVRLIAAALGESLVSGSPWVAVSKAFAMRGADGEKTNTPTRNQGKEHNMPSYSASSTPSKCVKRVPPIGWSTPPCPAREAVDPLPALAKTGGISRRGFINAGVLAAALCLGPRTSRADDGIVGAIREAAATSRLTVQRLRGNVSVILGSGGNVAVLTGGDGKLLVDAGIAVSQPRIVEALDGLSADPIRHLVNTHWHFDHTDGNNWLHQAGAGIVAHENTRKRLSVRHRVPGWRFTFPPAPKGALPSVVFTKDLVLDLNGERVELSYYEPAHTDSDISVHFTGADILHVADTWWNGVYPFIDYSSGGSIDGSIEAAEANLARVTDQTIIIPGHGPVGTRAELRDFRDMLVTIREKVAALKEAGRSLEESQAAKPTAAFDKRWGKFVTTPDAFTGLVYQGV